MAWLANRGPATLPDILCRMTSCRILSLRPPASDHPIVAWLAAEGRAASLGVLREGLPAFQKAYPFLVTASVKSNAGRR